MGRMRKAQNGKGGLVDESCTTKTRCLVYRKRPHKTTTEVLSYPVPCMFGNHHFSFVLSRMNTTRPYTWCKTFGHVKVDIVQHHTFRNLILRMQQLFCQIFQVGKNSWCLRNTKCPGHIRFQIDRRTGVLLCIRRTCWWLC